MGFRVGEAPGRRRGLAPRTPLVPGVQLGTAGVLGVLMALLLQVALRFTVGTPLAPEAMAQHLFRWVPMNLFAFFIQNLGESAKWLAFGGCVGVYLLLGFLAAPWVRRGGRWAAGFWVLAGAALQTWLLPRYGPWAPALAAYGLASATYVFAVRRFPVASEPPARAEPGTAAEPADPGRRRFLTVAAAVIVGTVAGWFVGASRVVAQGTGRLAAGITAILDRLRGAVPWITPNRDFYHVSKNLFDPRLSPADWSLRVDGRVENPFELGYGDLAALEGQVDQFTTLSCISNPVGGDLIGNARWRGVPLRRLLERARPQPGVVDLRFEAADGYTESIPLEKALHPETLLAWEMNGEPLPPDHGGPARLIVPGIYGMKHVKWITRIEAVDHDYLGFWEIRGWSDTAVTRTLSRIDVPRDGQTVGPEPIYVAGIAFAGDRGVARVEVSFDDGVTWREAALEPAPSPLTWVRWLIEWQAPRPGRYMLAVRAYDGRGEVQEAVPSGPLPEGATGLHRIRAIWRA